MRVIQFSQFGDPSQLHLVERPDMKSNESNAIVQVIAASVNPSDVKNVAGRMHQTTLPRVPGRDFSGVVVDGPAEWIGEEVWGTGGDVGFTRDGSHADFISVPRTSLVRKPVSLTHEQAGSDHFSDGSESQLRSGGLLPQRIAPDRTRHSQAGSRGLGPHPR